MPVAAVVTRVNAGYFDETDDIVGIAHVLEHMFFKGTERRGVGDIARETKSSGGYLNAHTIYDNTTYYTVLPASGLKAGLEIQADAYANSVINAEELARELEVIIQEAKRKSDNPSAVATETMYELLHEAHRIRRWRIGREAGLRRLNREQLLAFYRNFYRPSNTILAIAGAFDPGEILREVKRLYGALPGGAPVRASGPTETSLPSFRYRELAGDIAQTQVVISWRTPEALHEDTPALDLAASILATGRASRLYRAVRERKLASSVSAYNYTPTELGVFSLHCEGDPESALDAARVMWGEAAQLRTAQPNDAEMARVRSVIESRWVRRLETMEGKANYLADWEALGGWEMGDEYLTRILKVSPAEVMKAAAKYLKPELAGVLFYRPAEAVPIATGKHEMQELLESPPFSPVKVSPSATIAAASDRASADSEMEEAGVSVFRSRGGIPILVKHRPSPIVYMEVQVAGGSSLEVAERAGISNLAARTTVKGTQQLSAEEIATLAEEMGGSIGVHAGRDSVSWTFSVPVRAFERGVALLADVVMNATLEDDAIETERHAALSNLAMLRDDMYSYPVRLATLAAFSGHPYGIPVTGSEDSVRALKASDVRDWYMERMKRGEWTLGIVGDVNPQTAANVTGSAFGDLLQGRSVVTPPVDWGSNVERVVESRDKAQTAIALGFRGAGRNDPDRFVAALIATVASGLGGRFFEELRDRRSLAYTVNAFNAAHPAGGMFLSYIATSPDREDAARDGLLEQFQELTQSHVTGEELDRAQRYAIGTHAISQESGATLLSDMVSAFSFGTGLGELLEHDQRILSVTPEQMRLFARRNFDPARRVEGIIRGAGRTV